MQALKATSQEKSVFLRREKDAWASFEKERAAREAAEGELAKECEISAELRQKCSVLATEAREARDKVAPLEEKIGVLAQETEAQKAVAEGYRGEVARLEALLAEKDLALNQAQTDLAGALSEVARGHKSSAEHEKRAEGKIRALYFGLLYTFELAFPDFLFFTLFFDRVREEGGRGNLSCRDPAKVP